MNAEAQRRGGGQGASTPKDLLRAEDLRLGRAVDLKLLPRPLGAEPVSRERFVREARAASSLDQPSICTVHEIDEIPGEHSCWDLRLDRASTPSGATPASSGSRRAGSGR